MFVRVRYGDEQSRIFNAHCRNDILLETIRSQCLCDQNEVVEVSDEHGKVKNLRCFPTDYGSDFLKERETLVLLKVDGSDNTQTDKPVFTPLLKSLSYDKNFIDSINATMQAEGSRGTQTQAKSGVSSPPPSKKPTMRKATKMPVKK